ncbi:MAG: hypothetical protein HOV80_25845 [Polyangiaceae bacterium]|nr:hypothetical protein [Polyangiaceae bacterium]
MWIIVGGRTKVRPVEGGRVVQHHCEKCEKATKFAECDVKDALTVFFVSLLDMTSRRMVCMTCGDDVDPDKMPSAPASTRKLDAPASTKQLEAPASKRPRPDDPEIDDMLAALKKRIGKS